MPYLRSAGPSGRRGCSGTGTRTGAALGEPRCERQAMGVRPPRTGVCLETAGGEGDPGPVRTAHHPSVAAEPREEPAPEVEPLPRTSCPVGPSGGRCSGWVSHVAEATESPRTGVQPQDPRRTFVCAPATAQCHGLGATGWEPRAGWVRTETRMLSHSGGQRTVPAFRGPRRPRGSGHMPLHRVVLSSSLRPLALW